MTSTFSLIKSLQELFREAFSKYPLRYPDSKEEKYIKPSVYIGMCPPKKQGISVIAERGDPPFIVIRSFDGNITAEDRHEVNIGILCGIYVDEKTDNFELGYNDILNMVDKVMFTLFSTMYYDKNHWRLETQPNWTTGLQKEIDIYSAGLQGHPYYGAVVKAKFVTPQIPKPNMIER